MFVLSTQSADELDILHLTDYVMGTIPPKSSAKRPPRRKNRPKSDRAWFFKLFALRGMKATSSRCASSPICRRRMRRGDSLRAGKSRENRA